MYLHPHRPPHSMRSAQRGQAMILTMLLILAISASLFVYTATDTIATREVESDRTARAAMAEVKQALIYWSMRRDTPDGANARPGELPCPDINPRDGYEDGSCAAGALGRVPWKTLGIAEPKDASGETLWYTIAGSFRKQTDSPAAITSNTVGNITVYQNSGSTSASATTVTTQAIAVIFAPGAAQGAQDRTSSTTMACTAPSGTYARNLCASNYLETAVGPSGNVNNATINGPFVSAPASDTFNDKLMMITNADLMPAIEQEVARRMIGYLNSYRASTGVYPWADLGDGNSNGAQGTFAYNRSRFPCGTALPTSWAAAGITLPGWLTNGCNTGLTGWIGAIYYTVAKIRLQNGGSGCDPFPNCTASTLTVTNSSGRTALQCTTASPPTCTRQVVSTGSADLVLITPGAWNGTTTRTWPTTGWTTISGYFEDSANSDNDDDSYVVPSATANNRDRIFFVR